MKKCLALLLVLCLVPLTTGCGMFGIGAKSYDGSESFNDAHPEDNNPPAYMQGGDQHADGN